MKRRRRLKRRPNQQHRAVNMAAIERMQERLNRSPSKPITEAEFKALKRAYTDDPAAQSLLLKAAYWKQEDLTMTELFQLSEMVEKLNSSMLTRNSNTVTFEDNRRRRTVHIYRKIALPPGAGLLGVARVVFSRTQIEEVFEPLVADYQHEHMQGLAAGAGARRLRIIDSQYRIRYGIAFVRELGPVIWRVIVAIGVALRIAG
jgi:hypothetical protein